jgi:hypothetical protein
VLYRRRLVCCCCCCCCGQGRAKVSNRRCGVRHGGSDVLLGFRQGVITCGAEGITLRGAGGEDLARHPRPPGPLMRGLGGLQRSLRHTRREGHRRRGESELQIASFMCRSVPPRRGGGKGCRHSAGAAEGSFGGEAGDGQGCLVRAGVSIVKLWSDFKDYFQVITSVGSNARGGHGSVGAGAACQVHTKSVMGVRWLNLQDNRRLSSRLRACSVGGRTPGSRTTNLPRPASMPQGPAMWLPWWRRRWSWHAQRLQRPEATTRRSDEVPARGAAWETRNRVGSERAHL